MLSKGFIQSSVSPYGALMLFRLCIDYHGLNQQKVKIKYSLHRIYDMFDQFQGAKYFIKLDLRSDYNQIWIRDEYIYKIIVRTKYWHFEYILIPFGFTNALDTFIWLMNNIFCLYLDKSIIIFLHNILLYKKT